MRALTLALAPLFAIPAALAEPPTTEVVVHGDADEQSIEVSTADGPATGAHLGDALEAAPGIHMVRRGADAADPVIRGLSGDRVQTRVGVVPVHGACPSRMDPPVTYLGPSAADTAQVELAAPSVTWGGAATGGRIRVPVELRRAEDAPWTGWVETVGDSARAGGRLDGAVEGTLGPVDLKLAAGGSRLDDYEAPDGTLVPAGRTEATATAAASAALGGGQRVFSTLTYAYEQGVDTPSLPMDIVDSQLVLYNGGYRWRRADGALRAVDVEAGVSVVDHTMNNANKPNRKVMEAETPADADTLAARVAATWAPFGQARLITGVDAQNVARDATRTRTMVASGMTFQDHIWPDVSQLDLGAFAELRVPLRAGFRLEAGGRLDWVRSAAGGADDRSLGGKTIREHFVGFYGAQADEVDRSEALGGARLGLSWAGLDGLTVRFSSGLATAAADTTARYFAFAPAPGGFQVGNPALDAERRWSLDLGAEWTGRWLTLRASTYLNRVQDHIMRRTLQVRDVNGDGTPDRVWGFVNTHAQLVGGELAATVKPLPWLQLPLSAAYVHGQDTSLDAPLPEIPPLDVRAALRGESPGRAADGLGGWAEVGVRHAAAQDRVSDAFGEDATPAFTVVHLKLGVHLWQYGLAEVGVENLFDQQYHEHLTREVMLPVGGLGAGDELPAPGRRFFLRVRGAL